MVQLKKEFKILMARDLIKNIPGLSWMDKFVPEYISHLYDDLVKKISEIVCQDFLLLPLMTFYSTFDLILEIKYTTKPE